MSQKAWRAANVGFLLLLTVMSAIFPTASWGGWLVATFLAYQLWDKEQNGRRSNSADGEHEG